MLFPNGNLYSGTGTLVDNWHVLTAAHNLWGKDMGGNGFATKVTFSAAQNRNNVPFGQISATRAWITEDYQTTAPPSPLLENDDVGDCTKYIWDFGLVRLSQAVQPDAGYCSFKSYDDKTLTNNNIRITGYPGDQTAGTMWTATGRVTLSNDDDLLFYNKISTYKGQSGAGLMIPDNNTFVICGIHVAGSTKLNTNFAVRLNDTNVATIKQWQSSPVIAQT
ncbi:trypsin-like serine peptidase [Allocoleopsis franciscana]|nr:trypsin-like peptidase domain-containing protein [Allocoleopsis franciscana]